MKGQATPRILELIAELEAEGQKIAKVTYNNRRKSFAVKTRRGEYEYPYARLDQPMDDLVREAYIDRELGGEAFTYVLESGSEGALDYNSDPMYIADLVP